jgi:hypothetical protein
MGVNHGWGRGMNLPELAVGYTNTVCPPDFCHVSKILSARHGFFPPPQISTQIYATGNQTFTAAADGNNLRSDTRMILFFMRD